MLTGKDIDKSLNQALQHLDTLDLMPYIQKYNKEKLYHLMEKLEEIFPYKDQYSVTLFDCVAEDEFADYLNKRYGLKIREVTISYYEINI